MRTATIVEINIASKSLANLGNGLVAVQVNFFVFDGFPESLNEDVVSPTALAIHSDPNSVLLNQADKGGTGELAAMTAHVNRSLQKMQEGGAGNV